MINVLFPSSTTLSGGASSNMALQLGDIIKVVSPEDLLYDGKTFFIHYIDAEKIKLVNIQTYDKNQINIAKGGELENKAIKAIELISRADTPSYARQNELLPDKWINIAFSGDVPAILTGQIIDLVEDMIEIRLFPDKEVIYLNFDYKGLPDDIRDIQIRNAPTTALEETDEANEVDEAVEPEEDVAVVEPEGKMVYDDKQPQQGTIKGRIFLDMADIRFGKEVLEPVVQYMNVGEVGQRYSIEVQLADLLDDILSAIPTIDRTPAKMREIHTILERYKQLRQQASIFDENQNVAGIRRLLPDHKPLNEWFERLDKKLTWLLPVIKESKKYYYSESMKEYAPEVEDVDPNITPLSFEQTLNEIDTIYQTYKAANGANIGAAALLGANNRVSQFYTHMNPYMIPYNTLDGAAAAAIPEKEVNCDMYTLMNNNGDFTITDLANRSVPFFGQMATTGLTKLVSKYAAAGSRKQVTERAMMTPNDSINIVSFATMPIPYIKQSAIYLPGPAMNIYDIANTTSMMNEYAYYAYFENKPVVKTTAIAGADIVPTYDEEHAKNSQFIHNKYTLSNFATTTTTAGGNALDNLIPRTRAVFHLMRPYLSHEKGITYENIIGQLEPFLIYKNDITYSVYKDIVKYIQFAQTQYNKRLVENTRSLNVIKKYKNPVAIPKTRQYPFIYDVITNQQAQTDLIDNYQLAELVCLQKGSNADYIMSNAEAYLAMMRMDNCKYYNAIMSLQNIALMTPDAIMKLMSGDDVDADTDAKMAVANNKAAECKDVVIAKTYLSDDALVADNNNPNVYFDARNDTTNYAILDDYEKELTTITSKDLMPFLIAKLKSRFKLTETNAAYMAETLINGRKRIIDGQYATVSEGGNAPMSYFVRKANQWSKVKQPPFNGIATADENLLCNTQDTCLTTSTTITQKNTSVTMDKCEPMQMTKLEQRAKLIKQMSAEFDDKFVKSVEQLQKSLTQLVLYCQTQLPILRGFEVANRLKYDTKKVQLAALYKQTESNGAAAMASDVISPYAKGRDLVLNEGDFVTRQMNIIKFANHFTRKAYTHLEMGPLGQKESEHWLYCIKSNAKLLPAFLYSLATVYIETPDKYNEYIDQVVAKIGKLSDDGNMWVDMHSGYPIKMISSSSEEGFDDAGHKIVTRGEIEKIAGEEGDGASTTATAGVATTTKILPTDTLPLKYVKTITNYLLNSMGITMPIAQIEFIAETVIPIFEANLPNEADYNRTIKTLVNMGKKVISYEDIYNNLILYLTLGTYFVAIQTCIPPVQTRKTFPGCVRSFGGYPFDGEGNMSGIQYLACILVKIKNITAPWSILPKKEALVATKIREHIDKYILLLPEVKQRMDLKAQFLETHKDAVDVLIEYNVNMKWMQFLPPLVPVKLHPTAEPISAQFRSTLLADLKGGSISAATNKILILQSKIIQFSLAIQQSIQEVVNTQDAMLHKVSNDPYLENACCINAPRGEGAVQTTVEFFLDKRPDIAKNNAIVRDYALMIYDIKKYTEAPQIWCPLNDKIVYAELPVEYSEKTIYNAFISFCNFRNYQPIPADFMPFCGGEKLGNLQISDTLNEMIIKLKSEGRNYTYAQLLRFLQVIHRNHIIPLNTNITEHATPIQQFMTALPIIEQNIIDRADADESDKVELIELLKTTLAPRVIDPADIKTSAINNFLLAKIPAMKTRITAFMKRTLPAGKSMRTTNNFIANFATWKTDNTSDSGIDSNITGNIFNKFENISAFIKNIIFVFPTMIQNNVMHVDENIPKHWELAGNHEKDLRTMNTKYYEPLAQLTALIFSIGRILETIPDVGRATAALCDKSRNLFVYERTGGYLGEYFILRTFIDYIELADRPDMIVSTKEVGVGIEAANIYASTTAGPTLEEMEFEQNQLVYQGNRKTLCEHVGLVLHAYMEMYMRQKDMVDLSAQNIKEIVYNTQEAERKSVTDRLEQMSIEERAAENMMKQYKLGEIWGIGLQKALVEYVPKMYDKQQDFINTMIDAEMRTRVLLAMNGNDGDIGAAGVGNDDEWDADAGQQQRRRNRDRDLDEAAYRENAMPGDDADDYEEDNDYGNNDGEAYDNDD